MRVRVKKWGNSASVRIPAAIMESARLELDDDVEIHEERGKVIIEAVRRPADDLDRLVAGITPANRHDEISFGPPAGRELL